MHISYLRVIDINYQKIALVKWESKNAQNLAGFAVCSSYSPMFYVYVIFFKFMLTFFVFNYYLLPINIIDL